MEMRCLLFDALGFRLYTSSKKTFQNLKGFFMKDSLADCKMLIAKC